MAAAHEILVQAAAMKETMITAAKKTMMIMIRIDAVLAVGMMKTKITKKIMKIMMRMKTMMIMKAEAAQEM